MGKTIPSPAHHDDADVKHAIRKSCPDGVWINWKDRLQRDLRQSVAVIEEYSWLINAYVLDFYTEDHWTRLPSAWRDTFEKFENVNLLADLLLEDHPDPDVQFCPIVLPLSLLALRTCIWKLSASRIVEDKPASDHPSSPQNYIYKQVKEKKVHEIDRMGSLTASTARRCGTKYIVDFGAGLGHLARVLSFQHGIQVCCLEQQEKLSTEAKLLDERTQRIHQRQQRDNVEIITPVHLNFKLTAETDLQELLKKIRDAFETPPDDKDFSFGLVGLHPCGDLAIILTRFFLQCPNIRFLNIVGCCYMKLTTGEDPSIACHPVSRYMKELLPQGLSYEAREIACHAIESYADRLRTNNYDYLKIHCYRALLERILCAHDPNLRHCGLKSVKQKDGLTFHDYARIATSHLKSIQISEEELWASEIAEDVSQWKKVLIFYTLRLFLAPLIETVLLYDRMLWILETDDHCRVLLRATFDPMRSPRNHVLTADRGAL